MIQQLFTGEGIVWMLRARIVLYLVLLLVYIISPVDIIPEALAGILGLLDDVVLALLVFVYLTILYRRTLANNEG